MAKTVKLADIADRLGVSVVTVSKALSGQKGVGSELRKKIIELADELGYMLPSAADKVNVNKGKSNFIFPGTCDIEITTYEVDMPLMVQKTVEILDKLMRNEVLSSKAHIVTGHLVEKKSVRELKKERKNGG